MGTCENDSGYRTSWYDGWFFACVADRSSERTLGLNARIREIIAPGSTVLDIGCGTGSLAASLAGTCARVTALDISPRMISYARRHCRAANLDFLLVSSHARLTDCCRQPADYAVLKMVLHEMPEHDRAALLARARRTCRMLIIADWLAPQPGGLSGITTWLIERMAPREHFMSFRQWHAAGGIDGFLHRHGLAAAGEELFRNKTGKIVQVPCH